MMLSTVPLNFFPLYVSTRSSTSCPGRIRSMSVSLKFAITHTLSRAATARSDWPGETTCPASTAFRVTYPSTGERTVV